MARKKAAPKKKAQVKKKATKKAAKKKTQAKIDAGKKRSMARRFNDALTPKKASKAGAKSLDKRTARRLDRYRKELKSGKTSKGKRLSPLDVAAMVNDLLEYGETVTSLKKITKPRAVEFDHDTLVGILNEMHPVYGYRADAYRFAGVSNEALLEAGIIEKLPARRGPKPAAKKKAPAKKKGGKRKGKKR